jgi:hypothetical protein
MKTIKFITGLLFLSLVIGMAQCTYAQKEEEGYKTEMRDVKNFDGIRVQEGISVFLTMDSKESVKVEAPADKMEHVITELKDGKLKIHLDKNIKRHKIKVYVSAKQINSLKASSGASIKTENTVKTEQLLMSVSSGAGLEVDFSADRASCDASSGAGAELKGKVNKLKLDASSGASISAKNVEAERAHADVSSGASINLSVEKELEADASSGGSIRYKGSPTIVDIDKSSGGSVKSL